MRPDRAPWRWLLPAVFWLAVWWILALIVGKELLIPSPPLVVRTLLELVVTGAFWRYTALTLLRITLGLLLVMFGLLGDTLTSAPGVVFDLPGPVGHRGEGRLDAAPDATMLVLPSENTGKDRGGGTLVFFDDARYALGDPQSVELLRRQLRAHVQDGPARPTLLVLADRRVSAGELLKLVGIARESDFRQVQIAEKRQ